MIYCNSCGQEVRGAMGCTNQACGPNQAGYFGQQQRVPQLPDPDYWQRTAIQRIEKELSQQGAMLREILELLKAPKGQP